MARPGFAIILAVVFGGAPAAIAAPVVTEVIEYYDIDGATPQELRAQLNRLGPIDSTERRRHDARTQWFVNWRYNYKNAAGNCSIASVTVSVKITITMPRLRSGSTAPADLRQSFDSYLEKLLVHEKGHAQNAIDIAKRVEDGIAATPPQPACEQVGQAANTLGNSLLKDANRQDIEYDARTQHGKTQGARFP